MAQAEIWIGFPDDFDETGKMSCRESGEIAEHEQVWLFDLHYAQTLYALADSETGMALKDHMDAWGVQFSSKVFLPMEKILQAGLQRIDAQLTLVKESIQYEAHQIVLEISRGEGDWPVLTTRAHTDLSAELRSASVKALAQYYFIKNKLFRRELPLHLLAMRKYYIDGRPMSDAASMVEAPLYAMNKAMEYFEAVREGRTVN